MESQNLAYAPDTERELSVKSFLKWLGGFKNPREAMIKALTEGEAPKLKPRWDVHSRGDENWLGCASEALSSVLGEWSGTTV